RVASGNRRSRVYRRAENDINIERIDSFATMNVQLRILLISLYCFTFLPELRAQVEEDFSRAMAAAPAAQDNKEDTAIYTARYAPYPPLPRMKHGTFTQHIDALDKNFQYYSPPNQPRNATSHLGSYGLATRDMLLVHDKT